METALIKAKQLSGGASGLAVKLGITSQAVSQWRKVPAERVLDVEKATGGKVARHELRPDLYPPPVIVEFKTSEATA